MSHIAVNVNKLIDIDVEPVSKYRRAKVDPMSCKFVSLVSTTQNSTTLLYTCSSI